MMHARFAVASTLVILAGCYSPPPSSEDAAARERRPAIERMAPTAALYEAQRVADENARRRREAREAGGWGALRQSAGTPQQQSPSRTGLSDLEDVFGRTHCQNRLQDAARATFRAGGVYRWTETQLEARFPEKRHAGGDVTTYIGNAIEFLDEDGSWLRAVYECDYDHDSDEIVAVRTSERGR